MAAPAGVAARPVSQPRLQHYSTLDELIGLLYLHEAPGQGYTTLRGEGRAGEGQQGGGALTAAPFLHTPLLALLSS